MSKILSIDYGAKRCDLALSDELQMIGSPLRTVSTHGLMEELIQLIDEENLEGSVIGLPKDLKGEKTDAS